MHTFITLVTGLLLIEIKYKESHWWCKLDVRGTAPTSRYLHSVAIHQDSLYVFGGLGLKQKENIIKNLNDFYKINLTGLNLNYFSLIPDGPFQYILQSLLPEQICMLSRVSSSLYKRWLI